MLAVDLFNPSGHPQADALYRASMALIFVAFAALQLWAFWPEIETGWSRLRTAVSLKRAARKLTKAGAK